MSKPRRLAVLTTGRQDWGLLRPLCAALRDDDRFDLLLLVGGMALRPEFGNTVAEIRGLGFRVDAELDFGVVQGSAAAQTAAAVDRVAAALRELRPDALVLLGDRFETAGAALAATVETVPIVHLFGGEETEGAFDNSLRHAITKLSHLHFVAHDDYARRVVQMGEDPGSVQVIPNLGTWHLEGLKLPDRIELEGSLNMPLVDPIVLVTVHPTTLAADGEDELSAVVSAIRDIDATYILTLPNTDPGAGRIRDALVGLAGDRPRLKVVEALGESRYIGLMSISSVVLGNSSSGMIEAPALGVTTINVGDRQKGRVRYPSIKDVSSKAEEVKEALLAVIMAGSSGPSEHDDETRKPNASPLVVVETLACWNPPVPPRKRFQVFPQGIH